MRLYVDGVGVLAPGLLNWAEAQLVLRGERRYAATAMPRPSADLLPPAERRRCGDIVRLALHVGLEALRGSGARAEDLATVFASSAGDGEVLNEICRALAEPAREVSPTRFHNSVHNAPAGYWSIATGARGPSTSVCAYQGSFAAGLLEAALQCLADRRAVLLVAYDAPHPEPLASAAPVEGSLGAALVLQCARSPVSAAAIEVSLAPAGDDTGLADPGLERLRRGNSAARSLALLAALAGGAPARVVLGYLEELALVVAVTPCA